MKNGAGVQYQHSYNQFIVSGVLGLAMLVYCFTLPACPCNRNASEGQTLAERFGLNAFSLFKDRQMAIFFVFSMLLGVGAKTVTAYILLGRDGWGMAGAPVSSLLCDTVIVVCNLIFIARYAPDMLPSFRQGLPTVALPAGMAVGAVALTKLLRALLGWQTVTPLHTVASVACVACLYGAGLLTALLLGKQLPIDKKKESHHE
jgi:hypothetical protein